MNLDLLAGPVRSRTNQRARLSRAVRSSAHYEIKRSLVWESPRASTVLLPRSRAKVILFPRNWYNSAGLMPLRLPKPAGSANLHPGLRRYYNTIQKLSRLTKLSGTPTLPDGGHDGTQGPIQAGPPFGQKARRANRHDDNAHAVRRCAEGRSASRRS